LCAVAAGGLARKGVAGSFLSVSVNCNTGTLGLNWLYPKGFQTLTFQLPGEGLKIVRGYFQPTTDTFPHRKESVVHYPEEI